MCVEGCPAGAIALVDENVAEIDMGECIRCGRCHDMCPQSAVRHDGERIPMDVEANLAKTKDILARYDDEGERRQVLERMIRYFTKEAKVAEQTVERLKAGEW